MSKFIKLIFATLLMLPFSFAAEKSVDGTLLFGLNYAHAEKGSGRDGDGSDDDNSGKSGDDDDDDNSGEDDDDDDSGNDNASNNDAGDNKKSKRRVRLQNLHLRYPNGWDEKIHNGRYHLKDPMGRTVIRRRATQEDMIRMRAAVGK
jgi:hypothetical protein